MSTRVRRQPTTEYLQRLVQGSSFIGQLDVVSVDSREPPRDDAWLDMQSVYFTSKTTFSQIFSAIDARNPIAVLSARSEDVWSIDLSAVLTLRLSKDTYERLGIVGKQSGPRKRDVFIVKVDLRDSSRQAVRSRERLLQWDARRAEAGTSGWDVLLSSPLHSDDHTTKKWDVKPATRKFNDVRVPSHTLLPVDSDDADEELSTLFEWVGLSCLGSQRLGANDTVHPYVAACTFPASWAIGSLAHIRWVGFITPEFVQNVLNACLKQQGLVALTVSLLSQGDNERTNVWTLVSLSNIQGPGGPENECALAEYSK